MDDHDVGLQIIPPKKGSALTVRINQSDNSLIYCLIWEDSSSDEDEEEVAKAIDDIVTHFIQINKSFDDYDHGDNTQTSLTEKCYSHMATLDDNDYFAVFAAQIQNVLFAHSAFGSIPEPGFSRTFDDILIDTGAAKSSSAGFIQYEAYCKYFGRDPCMGRSKAVICHFRIGPTTSFGIEPIAFPIHSLWLTFDVHVVQADTPILLSIDDMDRLGIYLNYLDNQLVHQSTGLAASFQRKKEVPFVH